jgi:hypothetical protein
VFGAETGETLSTDQQVGQIIDVYKAVKLKRDLKTMPTLPSNMYDHGSRGPFFKSCRKLERVPRVIEMFWEIALSGENKSQNAARLAEVYRTRLDIIHGTGQEIDLETLPQSGHDSPNTPHFARLMPVF